MQSNKSNEIKNLPRSSLLNRLEAFLPAMAAANKELEEIEPTQKEAIQIDLTMEKTGENVPEEDDGSESHIEEKSTEQNQQMIEMSVALGNFDSNPVVSSLLANDDDDNDDNEISNDDQNSTGNAADEVDHVITFKSDVGKDKTGSRYSSSSSSNTANNDEHETDDEKVESPFLTEVSTKRFK